MSYSHEKYSPKHYLFHSHRTAEFQEHQIQRGRENNFNIQPSISYGESLLHKVYFMLFMLLGLRDSMSEVGNRNTGILLSLIEEVFLYIQDKMDETEFK